jgi:hypothetical protein
MTNARHLDMIRQVLTFGEDDVNWLLMAITNEDLGHIQASLKDASDRVKREIMRRGWENLTEVES